MKTTNICLTRVLLINNDIGSKLYIDIYIFDNNLSAINGLSYLSNRRLIVLYYIILCYIILYCFILYYIILYCFILYYIILYYIILYYIILAKHPSDGRVSA